MTKIVFALPDFRGGGAEKVIVTLANYFYQLGHDVSLVVRRNTGPRLKELNNQIDVIVLKGNSVISQAYEIKNICNDKNTDVIFSTLAMAHVSSISKLIGNRAKVVARLGNTISEDMKRYSFWKAKIMHLYQYVLMFSDEVVFQSQYMMDDFYEVLNLKNKNKGHVIYNPIDTSKIHALSNVDDSDCLSVKREDIICVGRLEYQKNYQLTLDIFRQFVLENKTSNLHILGDGNEKQELESLVKKYELESRVFFHGYQANPYKFMGRASVYFLTSRYEGFSNAIIEALSLGLTCVVSDVPGGNREIVEHGVNGYLFPPDDIDSAVQFLTRSIQSSHHKTVDDFEVNLIAKQYYDLF